MEIDSKLRAEELLEKLKKYSYSKVVFFLITDNSHPIVGRFWGNGFVLSRVSYWLAVSSFRPYFYGNVVASGIGSKIVGEFQISRFTKFLMAVFWVLGAIGLAFLAWKFFHWRSLGWKVFAPFLAFYILTFFAPRLFYNADRDDLYLMEFLKQCAGDGKVTHKNAKLGGPE